MVTTWQCMVLGCTLGGGLLWRTLLGQAVGPVWMWAVCALRHVCHLQCCATHTAAAERPLGTGFWRQWRRCDGQWARPCEHTWPRLLKVLPPLTPKSTSDGSGDFSVKRKLKHSVFFFFKSALLRGIKLHVFWVWWFENFTTRVLSRKHCHNQGDKHIRCSSEFVGSLCASSTPAFCHLLLSLWAGLHFLELPVQGVVLCVLCFENVCVCHGYSFLLLRIIPLDA